MAHNFSQAFEQLVALFKLKPASSTQQPYHKLRNFILDVLAQGRRKNIINLLMDVELTPLQSHMAQWTANHQQALSLTSYICKSLACAVGEDKSMHAYRKGKSKLIIFDDVDLSVMVEREMDGHTMPVVQIIRAANSKSMSQVAQEIRAAKITEIGTTGPLNALDKLFFSLPTILRKIVWWEMRRDPQLFKQLVGTVGVTSMGMHASGPALVIPITPLTLTLSIGAVVKKCVLEHGQAVEKEFIQMNLGADHDIIDGAPLMRFADRFRKHLLIGSAVGKNSNGSNP